MNNDLEQFSEGELYEISQLTGGYPEWVPSYDQIKALARIALAAKQAKPVGYLFVSSDGCIAYSISNVEFEGVKLVGPIYSTPQPAQTEQVGWIKCSDRMPDSDEHKPIAIYTGNCIGQGMFVACYDEGGFFDYWDGVEISGISHWMPLPPPPAAAPKPESE